MEIKMSAEKVAASIFGFVLLVVIFFSVMTCNYVQPGYIGIVVYNYGNESGVQNIPTRTGYVWYNRWTTNVYEYPTFRQQKEFNGAERMTFASDKGIEVKSDIKLHYTIQASKAPAVFVKLRGDEKAVEQYLKGCTQDAIGKAASEMSINQIYGEGKAELLSNAKKILKETLGDDIDIDFLGFSGAPSLPPNIVEAINRTIEAEQEAIAEQNRVIKSKAIADQKIEDARGRGQSVLDEAVKQAEANLKLSASLTPELVKWQAIQKWNGQLPNVTGGAVPMIDVGK